MRKGLLAESPPFTQLVMVVFTMITCSLLLMFVGILFAPLILGIPVTAFMDVLGSGGMSANPGLMRYLQVLQGISLFIVPALFAGYLFSGNTVGYFGFCNAVSLKWLCAVLLIVPTAVPFVNLLGMLNESIVFPKGLSGLEQKFKMLEESAREATRLFLDVGSIGGLFFNIFMIAVLPAIGEELIFRGIIQKIFIRWTGNIHMAIVVTGFLFSLMHMQFYGFFPRWLLGIVFGYLLVWSGSIWIPVIAHFINNALAVIVSFLVNKGYVPGEAEVFGTAWSDIPVTIITTAICGWLLWKMYRKRVKPEPQS